MEHNATYAQEFRDFNEHHDAMPPNDAEHHAGDDHSLHADMDSMMRGDEVAAGGAGGGAGDEEVVVKVLMPEQPLAERDGYLCTSVPLDAERPMKLVRLDWPVCVEWFALARCVAVAHTISHPVLAPCR